MVSCGCRPGTSVRGWCPEGRRLAKKEAEAMELRVRLLRRGVEDPDYIDARRRLQEDHDVLMRHLAGQAEAELDRYESDERAALKAGA